MLEDGGEVRDEIGLLDIEAVEQLDDPDALWHGGVDVKKGSGKKKTDRRLTHQHTHISLSESEDKHARTTFCIHNMSQQQNHTLRYLPASVKRPRSLSPSYSTLPPHDRPASFPLLSRLHCARAVCGIGNKRRAQADQFEDCFANVKPCKPRTETPAQRDRAMETIDSAIERAVAKAVIQNAQTPIEIARYRIAQVSVCSLRYPRVFLSCLASLRTHMYNQMGSPHVLSIT